MMKILKYLLISLIFIASCTDSETRTGVIISKENNVIQDVKNEIESDTLINESVYIFLSPNDVEISQLKAKHGEDNFYIIADDANAYDFEATEILKQNNSRYIFTEKRTINFPKENYTFKKDEIEDCKWLILEYKTGAVPKVFCPVDFIEKFQTPKITNGAYPKGLWKEFCDGENKLFIDEISANLKFVDLFSINCIVGPDGTEGRDMYLIKFQDTTPLIPNKKLEWQDFSKDSAIAKVELIQGEKLLFTWLGFYNLKKKYREGIKIGFNSNDTTSTLVKCSDR